jgi:hypothetical protein
MIMLFNTYTKGRRYYSCISIAQIYRKVGDEVYIVIDTSVGELYERL